MDPMGKLGKPTVDGSEIRRLHQLRLLVNIPLFADFVFYIPGGDCRISEPSTVLFSILGGSKRSDQMLSHSSPYEEG